jgi:Lipase (class 3)
VTLPELSVSGGAGGTSAHYADLGLLARRSESDAGDYAAIDARAHGILLDGDVVASGVLDPVGMVRFAETLLSTLDGPDGLTALAVRMQLRGVALRAAAASYHAVDEAQRDLIDSIRFVAGFALGTAPLLPVAAGLLGVGGMALAGRLGATVDWQGLLTAHPGLVDNLVGVAPGLIDGLPFLHGDATDLASAARLVGELYPDGPAMVTSLGADTHDPSMVVPPNGFGDLVDGLAYRDAEASGSHQGDIDVRVVTAADGSRSYIVDIPGTKDWHVAPGVHAGPLNDLGTNLHAMGGQSTSYEQGVAEALRQAGAGPGDPVMLVGHSQGGIVATDAANHFVSSGQFNVTHVVTLGSPVGRLDVPDSVAMLSVENRNDIVAHLDAADNPDTPNRTTVTYGDDHGNVGDNHSLGGSYEPAAEALDASTDPSVVAFRDSASAFLGQPPGRCVTSYVYEVRRG